MALLSESHWRVMVPSGGLVAVYREYVDNRNQPARNFLYCMMSVVGLM